MNRLSEVENVESRLRAWEGSDVIITSYFFSKPNPQSGKFVAGDSIEYIFPWISSVCFNKLQGIIIHDGLSDEFVNKHASNNVVFYKYQVGALSLNDERYVAVDEILRSYHFRRVLITDGSDLFIKKNPFEFMKDPTLLYFGSDMPSCELVRDNPWCMRKLQQLAAIKSDMIDLEESFLRFKYVNAGVIGGWYEKMKAFVEGLALGLSGLNDGNHNMMFMNYLLWKYGIPHFSGPPLTSPFKKYELDGNYYIVHK
jgi:hypothetical protein